MCAMGVDGWTDDVWSSFAEPFVTDALRPLLEAAVGTDLRNARLPRWYAASKPLAEQASGDLVAFLENTLHRLSWSPRPGYYGPAALSRNISGPNLAALGAVVLAAAHLGEKAPIEAIAKATARAFEKLPHSGVPAPDLGRCGAFALGRLGEPGGRALLAGR